MVPRLEMVLFFFPTSSHRYQYCADIITSRLRLVQHRPLSSELLRRNSSSSNPQKKRILSAMPQITLFPWVRLPPSLYCYSWPAMSAVPTPPSTTHPTPDPTDFALLVSRLICNLQDPITVTERFQNVHSEFKHDPSRQGQARKKPCATLWARHRGLESRTATLDWLLDFRVRYWLCDLKQAWETYGESNVTFTKTLVFEEVD
jgi:hypothetical protein